MASDALGDQLLEAFGVFDDEVATASHVGAENGRGAELANDGNPVVADDTERVGFEGNPFLLAKLPAQPAAIGVVPDAVGFWDGIGFVVEGVVVPQVDVVSGVKTSLAATQTAKRGDFGLERGDCETCLYVGHKRSGVPGAT